VLSLLGRTPDRLSSGSGPEMPTRPYEHHHCFLSALYGRDGMGITAPVTLNWMLARPPDVCTCFVTLEG